MRGAKLLRSGWMSPRRTVGLNGEFGGERGRQLRVCPLGTISESELKSNVSAWSFRLL